LLKRKYAFCTSYFLDPKPKFLNPKQTSLMIRKFTVFWFAAVFIVVSSCSDDEVSAPPASAVDVDTETGFADETEFTFEIDQVSANTVALWPEGLNSSEPGIVISQSAFAGGKASVTYKYSHVGTFKPAVVTTNFNKSGSTASTVAEYANSISISSKKNKITSFNFGKKTVVDNTGGNVQQWTQQSIKTVIMDKNDLDTDTITVTIPFDPFGADDRVGMKAQFASSYGSTVKVGGTAQSSEVTMNNWTTLAGPYNTWNDLTTPVTYTVTSHDGTIRTYLVQVIQVHASAHTQISSFSAKAKSKLYKDKVFKGYADSVNQVAIIYAPYGTASQANDSLEVSYGLSSPFSSLFLESESAALEQGTELDLSTPTEFTVEAQDGATATVYDVYYVEAPRLTVTFGLLNPEVSGSTGTDYATTLSVLSTTPINPISATFDVDEPNVGVVVSNIAVTHGPSTASTTSNTIPGGVILIDATYAMTVKLTVVDSNIGYTYTAIYKVTVKTL
jgi:hypothetical protein